jgi:hypothetical protein
MIKIGNLQELRGTRLSLPSWHLKDRAPLVERRCFDQSTSATKMLIDFKDAHAFYVSLFGRVELLLV